MKIIRTARPMSRCSLGPGIKSMSVNNIMFAMSRSEGFASGIRDSHSLLFVKCSQFSHGIPCSLHDKNHFHPINSEE